jgi:hypothetical protein
VIGDCFAANVRFRQMLLICNLDSNGCSPADQLDRQALFERGDGLLSQGNIKESNSVNAYNQYG